MSASTFLQQAVLDLLFNAAAIVHLADDASTDPATQLWIGLHTDDPGEDGDQTTNEVAWDGYARIAVSRDAGGFGRSGNTMSNASPVTFDEVTGSPGSDVTYFSIGSDASGAGTLYFSGTLGSTFTPSIGSIPQFASGELIISAD